MKNQFLYRMIMRALLLLKSTRGECKLEKNEEFKVIDGVLYYIHGKDRVRIKEHFSDSKVGIRDLIMSVIKYDMRSAKNLSENS